MLQFVNQSQALSVTDQGKRIYPAAEAGPLSSSEPQRYPLFSTVGNSPESVQRLKIAFTQRHRHRGTHSPASLPKSNTSAQISSQLSIGCTV